MEAIETHRDPCLRGEREPTQDIVDACESAFKTVHQVLIQRYERSLA